MQKVLRKILLKPVLWLTKWFSGSPDPSKIYEALNNLQQKILEHEHEKGLIIPFIADESRFIIFSDMHKGGGDKADDFMLCEDNYIAALQYYHQNGFHYIQLGDAEELWESNLAAIKKVHPKTYTVEQQFIPANAFIKVYGNHDLYWNNDPFASMELKKFFKSAIPVYEGVILETQIDGKPFQVYCTHGHQGDRLSDGNWFSKFFVARIWAPLQAYLGINPNTPAYDASLKNRHNTVMYEWSSRHKGTILITGHTHQPVFASLTHLERLLRQLLICRQNKNEADAIKVEKEIEKRKYQYQHISEDYLNLRPTYFNSGCCCYDDGDITGIEIDQGCIRLIK